MRSFSASCCGYSQTLRPTSAAKVDAVPGSREAQLDAVVAGADGARTARLADRRRAARRCPARGCPRGSCSRSRSRDRWSTTIDSMPGLARRRCESSRPAGPAPTIATRVRAVVVMASPSTDWQRMPQPQCCDSHSSASVARRDPIERESRAQPAEAQRPARCRACRRAARPGRARPASSRAQHDRQCGDHGAGLIAHRDRDARRDRLRCSPAATACPSARTSASLRRSAVGIGDRLRGERHERRGRGRAPGGRGRRTRAGPVRTTTRAGEACPRRASRSNPSPARSAARGRAPRPARGSPVGCARAPVPARAPSTAIAAWRSRSACDERVASSHSRMPTRMRRSSSRSSSPASTSSPTSRCAVEPEQPRTPSDLGRGLHGACRGEGLEHAHEPIDHRSRRTVELAMNKDDTTPIGWESACGRSSRPEDHRKPPSDRVGCPIDLEGDADDHSRRAGEPARIARPALASRDHAGDHRLSRSRRRPRGGGRAGGR